MRLIATPLLLLLALFLIASFSHNYTVQVIWLFLTAAVIVLAVIYALTRFVVWAAHR